MVEFLTTTLGTAIKSLATKAVTGPVEGMARKALQEVNGQPADEATVAVRKAVEAARQDLINDYWAGEDALSRDVVTLLEHPPFAEAVVRQLLFRGQPDFDRLRRAYLMYEPGENPNAAAERWQTLQDPLAFFFETIEEYLLADPLFGPLLRDSRKLASLRRLEADQCVIADASREIQRYQEITARATESGNDQRVLFDGLDEVPAGDDEIDRRKIIVTAVEAFRAAHPKCRVLVTCRVKPYREGSSRLSGCPVYQLAALDDDRVHRFCKRWYDELARVGRLSADEADERRERLLAALQVRPVLREMSGTPLLLPRPACRGSFLPCSGSTVSRSATSYWCARCRR